MALTYELIASNTIGSGGASSITFSSIPSTYTDLLIRVSSRTTENPGPSTLGMQINGASTTLSPLIGSLGNGSAATSQGPTGTSSGFGRFVVRNGQAADTTASTFSNHEIYIPNYTSANFKTISDDGVTENNATTAYVELNTTLWSSTSAITSLAINVYGGGGSFVQYSSFYLYGIKNS